MNNTTSEKNSRPAFLRRAAIAFVIAAAAFPAPAMADHCSGRGHLPGGECFPDLSPLNPPQNPVPFTPVQTPQIDTSTSDDYIYWIAGGTVLAVMVASVVDENAAAALVANGWRFSDELGGIGWSYPLGEKTLFTFAADLPTEDKPKTRAEIKFSF